ncbi:MAG: hypothetical protein IPI33_09785 [Dehalococcoidia bacterium]|nr:hypothetical protein [Dehalococcoidia bacterium]
MKTGDLLGGFVREDHFPALQNHHREPEVALGLEDGFAEGGFLALDCERLAKRDDLLDDHQAEGGDAGEQEVDGVFVLQFERSEDGHACGSGVGKGARANHSQRRDAEGQARRQDRGEGDQPVPDVPGAVIGERIVVVGDIRDREGDCDEQQERVPRSDAPAVDAG